MFSFSGMNRYCNRELGGKSSVGLLGCPHREERWAVASIVAHSLTLVFINSRFEARPFPGKGILSSSTIKSL